jgi:hypothetical protein
MRNNSEFRKQEEKRMKQLLKVAKRFAVMNDKKFQKGRIL